MRKGIIVTVTACARARLRAVVTNRNSPQKHVWRAKILLLTADGLGTGAIMRGTGRAKSVVWRWQERFMREGVEGLLRDKTRPPGRKALDRTQPGLPMKKGRAGPLTHDYKRHGTTTLSAALNVLEGNVIGRCMQRHRHQEFIRFLNAIEAEIPAGKIIHVVLDNYATHKHPKAKASLPRHPRFACPLTPKPPSYPNARNTPPALPAHR